MISNDDYCCEWKVGPVESFLEDVTSLFINLKTWSIEQSMDFVCYQIQYNSLWIFIKARQLYLHNYILTRLPHIILSKEGFIAYHVEFYINVEVYVLSNMLSFIPQIKKNYKLIGHVIRTENFLWKQLYIILIPSSHTFL